MTEFRIRKFFLKGLVRVVVYVDQIEQRHGEVKNLTMSSETYYYRNNRQKVGSDKGLSCRMEQMKETSTLTMDSVSSLINYKSFN